jgi:hypothetical protein
VIEAQKLAQLLERADVHRLALDGHRGAYALGVTELDGAPALHLHVPGPRAPSRRTITVDGEAIPMIVEGGFRAPRPL